MPILIAVGIVALVAAFLVSQMLDRGAGGPRLPAPPAREATEADVIRLAMAGQKIEAIKLYRALSGLGLKEAKDAVDQIGTLGRLPPRPEC